MRLEELEREIRAERPEPDTEFARRLDEWAAAGFPRGGELDPRAERRAGASGWLAGLRERLSVTPPRRLLAPVGAVATAVVIGAVAIGQSGEIGGGKEETSGPVATTVGENEPSAGGAARKERGVAFNAASPADARSALEESARSAPAPDETTILPAPDTDLAPPDDPSGSGIARGTDRRLVDASARLTLGAEAGEVQDVANGVIDVTDASKGVVLDSQVTSDQGGARASFTLEIPFRNLDTALEDLSDLADVVSLAEQGEDITARAVRARKQLAGVFDRIRRARIELIQADTREERLVVKSQIDSLEATADSVEQRLGGVKRQARFATVQVEITSNGPGAGDEDGWSLGDALGDAGRVLETIGGILLVSLAVLVPLALLGALAWLVAARVRTRSRERALDA